MSKYITFFGGVEIEAQKSDLDLSYEVGAVVAKNGFSLKKVDMEGIWNRPLKDAKTMLGSGSY